ncbi:metallophosphoesterase family protein [Methylohalobius crimeensis]|uniref:metallophosphoesterase family protein n=1 Tax=Methylohalobius crimeensis TaxID=244365 RepID=UPI0003FCD313|nr:metallophosphoesterase [Methylohalobius crimeensis]
MIFFVGDPHGRFQPIIDCVQTHRPDAVILLGDMTPDRPLDEVLAPILDVTEVYWIPVNHDGDRDEWYDRVFGSGLAERNIHGRVVQIGNIRIAGLGGVFRGKIWFPKDNSDTHGWPTKKKNGSGRWEKAIAGVVGCHGSTGSRFSLANSIGSSLTGPMSW